MVQELHVSVDNWTQCFHPMSIIYYIWTLWSVWSYLYHNCLPQTKTEAQFKLSFVIFQPLLVVILTHEKQLLMLHEALLLWLTEMKYILYICYCG